MVFRKITWLLVFVLILFSCQPKKREVVNESNGFIEFKQKSFSFGQLNHGDVVGHKFRFKNTGNGPVAILNVEKSCGCTEVKYPRHLIMPGDSAYVEVVFNTKGWSGKQVKQVRLITNDSEGAKELRIWAEVQ